MAGVVLDASAVIALIRGELGWNRVMTEMPTALISSVNAAEVFAKLSEWRVGRAEVERCHALLADITVAFDTDLARRSGALRAPTQSSVCRWEIALVLPLLSAWVNLPLRAIASGLK